MEGSESHPVVPASCTTRTPPSPAGISRDGEGRAEAATRATTGDGKTVRGGEIRPSLRSSLGSGEGQGSLQASLRSISVVRSSRQLNACHQQLCAKHITSSQAANVLFPVCCTRGPSVWSCHLCWIRSPPLCPPASSRCCDCRIDTQVRDGQRHRRSSAAAAMRCRLFHFVTDRLCRMRLLPLEPAFVVVWIMFGLSVLTASRGVLSTLPSLSSLLRRWKFASREVRHSQHAKMRRAEPEI
jgi:hypothetical protein